MLVPEIILYNAVKGFFSLVSTDYNIATDKTQTILHDLFAVDNNNNTLQWENINYFEQASTLFGRTSEHPRKCTVNIGYNLQRAYLPCVHIMLPQESSGRYNSIGLSEGEVNVEYHPEGSPSYEIITRTKTYASTFDLMVTSDNATDILLIYYLLKSLFPYISDTFEILGLHNFKTSGMDVQLDDKFAPNNIFHRNLRVDFDYQSQTKIRNTKNFATSMQFLICANIGDDNKPLNNIQPIQNIQSNSYTISISKTLQSGIVGSIRFLNAITLQLVSVVQLDLTGQSNDFELSGSLTPGNYRVEVILQNYSIAVYGSLSDDEVLEYQFNTNGQFSFDQVYDFSKVKGPNINIQFNFS